MCWRGLLEVKFTPQVIQDVWVIEPKVYGDHRGYFVEKFRQDKFEDALGFKVNFVQDNESKSSKEYYVACIFN